MHNKPMNQLNSRLLRVLVHVDPSLETWLGLHLSPLLLIIQRPTRQYRPPTPLHRMRRPCWGFNH